MRIPQLLTGLLLTIGSASAQLINGSFENGANGWTVPCECEPAFFSPDGVPGAGAQCLGIENYHVDCGCMLFETVVQFTPWMTPGPWRLSGWIKSAVPGDIPGSGIGVVDGPGFSTPHIVHLSSSAGVWEYVEQDFQIDLGTVLDSIRVFVVPDDGNEQPSTLCYFDDLQVTSLLNTRVSASEQDRPSFRPNPATDRLWIDLPVAPTSITAIDATGRTQALTNFQHTSRTVEVDVRALPTGINVLRILAPSGTRTIRFIKT